MQKIKMKDHIIILHVSETITFFFYECTIAIQSSSYMYMANGA